MKRTGFARKVYSPARVPVVPIQRDLAERIHTGPARLSVAVKPHAYQHRAFMAAVRGLPCYRCGAAPRSQFAHADVLGEGGKGMGTKSDCRLGYPLCWVCHHEIGTARVLPKEARREWEAEAGRRTRAEINRQGLWPANLPQWPEDEEA